MNLVISSVESKILVGSTFKLISIQSKKFSSLESQNSEVVRFFLLYRISISTEGDYILKRAIVDFNIRTSEPYIVDWSEIKSDSEFTKIDRKEVDKSEYESVLSKYKSIYSSTSQSQA